MAALKRRIKNIIKTVAYIVRNRQFKLLLHLSSIDHDFLCQSQIPGDRSWENFVHPLFDPDFYRSRYLESSYRGSPFVHFLTEGYLSRNRPGPFFNYDIYQQSSDWQPGFGNPLKHYLSSGTKKSRPGIFFDTQWYKDRTPVLHERNIDPVKHYKLHGCGEGKSPIPMFDPQWYSRYISPGQETADGLSHYLLYGIKAGNAPCTFFDPHYYQKRYSPEIGDWSAFEHYLREGVHKGYYISERVEQLKQKPLLSIIVPVYNAEPGFLNNCIRSVLYQQYPHWQLCLADDGSTRGGIREQLEYWSGRDRRIKVLFMANNQGISVASNNAAGLADGDYLGFLDNDDELTPDCLYHVAETISGLSPEVIYTDEALVGSDGRKFSTFYKPGFNSVLLLSHNYITHFVVVSKRLFADCQGLRPRYDGAQDLDFMLRATKRAEKIIHIPRVLYHWRATKTSTSINHDQKSYAHEAGKKALQAYFEKNRGDVDVLDGAINYSYRVRRELDTEPSVSVLIWSKDPGEEIARIETIKSKTNYRNCEFVLLASLPSPSDRQTFKIGTRPGNAIRLVERKDGESKAQAFDDFISSCSCEYLLFIDSSVEDVDPEWVRELVSQISFSKAGLVCGRFSYLQGNEPSYTVPDLSSSSPYYYQQFITSCSRHANGLHYQQSIYFAPWDISIIRRSDYQRHGGFDHEKFPGLFAMTDLCLRAARKGMVSIYTPFARVYGQEPEVQVAESLAKHVIEEKVTFQKTWHNVLCQKDPYYNLGILDENKVDRGEFMNWLTGTVLEVKS